MKLFDLKSHGKQHNARAFDMYISSDILYKLQQENNKLKKEKEDLQERIDKAIDYIEQLEHSEWVIFGRRILLEILKGEDK